MENLDTKYARFRGAKCIEILKVEVNEGAGVDDDPIRRVAYYLDPKTGEVLFKRGEDRERQFAGGDMMYPD